MEVIKAYPLQWPAGWKRTEPHRRVRAQFGRAVYVPSSQEGGTGYTQKGELSINDAVTRVRQELGRMQVREDDVVISSNLVLRLDGFPKSGQAQPRDPGAAVYWRVRDQTRCMAIDQYTKVEHNIAAIAATIDAMRAIKRHGGAEILDRAFTGFAALPPPMEAARPWRDVLGVAEDERNPGRILECYRIQRSKAHPDKLQGGTSAAFQAVERAYEAAQRELGFRP